MTERGFPAPRTMVGDPPLAVYDSGGRAGRATPLLFIHGSVSSAREWDGVLSKLQSERRCVAYDQRGHGASGHAARYLLSDYIQDAERVLRDVVAEPAVVIGHSLGALVALGVAARAPGLTRAAVLEDPPLSGYGPPSPPTGFFGLLRAVLDQRDRPEEFERALGAVPMRGGRTFGEALGGGLRSIAAMYRTLDAGTLDAVLTGDPAGASLIDTALRDAPQPALLLVADPAAGAALRPEDVTRMERTHRDLTVMHFPGAGHSIKRAQPQAFLDAVRSFLRRVA